MKRSLEEWGIAMARRLPDTAGQRSEPSDARPRHRRQPFIIALTFDTSHLTMKSTRLMILEERSMSYADIAYELRDGSARITLNRPEELNAIGPRLIEEFGDALDRAADDVGVLALVVTGAGRAFCAGADLKFLNEAPAERRATAAAAFVRSASLLMDRIEAFPKPVVAAVNGLATAGGMELVLSCDLVLAVRGARLGDGHANYGLLPGAGASVRLPRKIGVTLAKQLFFTGDLVSADELAARGLINQVVGDGELEGAVDALVRKLATKSPLGLARMKQLVDDGLNQPRETAMRLELAMSALHLHSADFQEGLAAFNAKRKPRFVGH
ncbi:enoyl-CoA hydratase/isomerase family protein [Azospirillum sp. HJ39]|uniref:enoyl-CoA hydratase/isomerase family protein n=1 Tax=Azospirillum sp. HJ39 TaxID=3159496 RepID=UPI0035566FC0